jgi:hypothetical protein
MKRTYPVLALLTAMALSTHVNVARGYESDDGGYVDTPLGPIPADLMYQAEGCPYLASALYQQQVYSGQRQSLPLTGNNPNGDSQLGTGTNAPGSNSASFASNGSQRKTNSAAKRASAVKKANAAKKASAGPATTDPARSKTSATGRSIASR